MFDNYPELFAVFHARHRLLTPRHPPCALNSLTTNIQSSPPRLFAHGALSFRKCTPRSPRLDIETPDPRVATLLLTFTASRLKKCSLRLGNRKVIPCSPRKETARIASNEIFALVFSACFIARPAINRPRNLQATLTKRTHP